MHPKSDATTMEIESRAVNSLQAYTGVVDNRHTNTVAVNTDMICPNKKVLENNCFTGSAL
jgi:hypothetical protein